MTTLTCWSVCLASDSDYTAPELAGYALTGIVSGHPKKPDGMLVKTSRIVSVDGTKVVTANTTYQLNGPPTQRWLTWLAENGYEFDPENPVTPKRVEAAE
jgi:hypothetical protein